MLIGNRLQPDALPYAGYRRIPHASVLILLLAPRVFVVKAVADFHDDTVRLWFCGSFVFTGAEDIAYIKAEREIAALMFARKFAVDIYTCGLIGSAEMKDKLFAGPFRRHGKLSAVQHDLIGSDTAFYSG